MEPEVRSILSKKDPQGYFVIVADAKAKELVKDIDDVFVEEIGDCVIIKTKSRRIAERLARKLLRLGMLRFEL